MKPGEVDRAYVGLLARFSDICNSASYHVKKPGGRGFKSKTEGQDHFVESLLYLPSWGCKPSSPKRCIDIIVRSNEHFRYKKNEISKSTVQVMYFNADSHKARILLGIHFDFESPVQLAHPVFHAQLDVTTLNKEEYESVGFRKTIVDAQTHHYSHLRIPTPHMGLGAVLLALSADHLPVAFHTEFLNAIRENPTVKWDVMCASLKSSLGSSVGYLHSHHWY